MAKRQIWSIRLILSIYEWDYGLLLYLSVRLVNISAIFDINELDIDSVQCIVFSLGFELT